MLLWECAAVRNCCLRDQNFKLRLKDWPLHHRGLKKIPRGAVRPRSLKAGAAQLCVFSRLLWTEKWCFISPQNTKRVESGSVLKWKRRNFQADYITPRSLKRVGLTKSNNQPWIRVFIEVGDGRAVANIKEPDLIFNPPRVKTNWTPPKKLNQLIQNYDQEESRPSGFVWW